jgi:hypothetical protein
MRKGRKKVIRPNGRAWLTTPDVVAAGIDIASAAQEQEANLREKKCSARSAGAVGRNI